VTPAPTADRTAPGRRLRILWLIKGLGPGGAERLLVSQAGATERGDRLIAKPFRAYQLAQAVRGALDEPRS
jgi:hypothetical protein